MFSHTCSKKLQKGMKQTEVKYKCKKSNSGKKSSKQMKKIKTNKKIKHRKSMLTLNKPHAFPKKMYLFAGYHLGRVTDLIYSRLVINVCKAVPISLFWARNELNASTLVLFEFPFNSIGK